MANTCVTCYHIEGDKQDLKEIYDLFQNTRHEKWLGNVINKLGKNPDDYDCAGEWAYIDNENDVYIVTESKWVESNDVFNLIKEKYPSVEIYWQAEELGCDYFCTNDMLGKYFTDHWVLCSNNYDMEYYAKDEAERLLKDIENMFGIKFESAEEADKEQDNNQFHLIECQYKNDL
jgi:hypothetical protein